MNLELSDEDLPNDRSEDVVISESSQSMTPNVLLATGGFFGDQESLKTTRIIIHNPSSLDVLKNAHQTITFNPLNRSLSVPEKNINWDPSVYDQILPVRCRDVRGELHKNKFGSGNKGHSILSNGTWYTPSEFESVCGRGSSKDWKRSIRYGGRTLMCLIDQGILRPHATSCTCGACCEDGSSKEGSSDPSNGPVRLFTPYKRRKRHNHPKLKVLATNVEILPNENVASAPADINSDITSINDLCSSSIGTLTVTKSPGTVLCTDSVIVTPEAKSQPSQVIPSTTMDFNEQKQWWQLEEMVKNAVRQILDLQKHVETVKNQSAIAREQALQELRLQLEKEKKEALNACRLEGQLALSRVILEAKSEKENAVQQALEQSHLEMKEKLHSFVSDKDLSKLCANCNREAYSECTGCHCVSYCSPFCQKKDWLTHKDECGENILDADCSELIDDCDGPSSS